MGSWCTICADRPRAVRRQRGFTLLEMIVVVAILGMMAMLIVSRGPMRSARLDLDGTAGQMAQSLRLARSQAIAHNRIVTWTVKPGEGFGPADRPPQPIPAGLAVAQSETIGFAGDGSSSGGQVILRGRGRQVAIAVDWLTGRVRLAESQ